MKELSDIGRAFEDLKDQMFFKHRGVMIELVPGGFKVWDKEFKTVEEVDEFLLRMGKNIEKSLNTDNAQK